MRTLLHDMAFDGDVRKASLLLDHGADINAIGDEYHSQRRWAMPRILADGNSSRFSWSGVPIQRNQARRGQRQWPGRGREGTPSSNPTSAKRMRRLEKSLRRRRETVDRNLPNRARTRGNEVPNDQATRTGI